MLNGVMMTEPMQNKRRPSISFDAYYLPINERCIAGKSLVFSLQNDEWLMNFINDF
jgi:hypothetical protein